jgi:carboxypeptidase A4
MSWFNSYHSYDEHMSFLAQLVTKFPGNAKIVTAGTSYQGRPITGIHIYGSSGGSYRPAVILHGTVHAREWITTVFSNLYIFVPKLNRGR